MSLVCKSLHFLVGLRLRNGKVRGGYRVIFGPSPHTGERS